LNELEAARRRERFGPNRLSEEERKSPLAELVESLREPLQLLLIAVGVLSAIFGELRDAIAIFVIIGAVAAIETLTELRARRALEALRRLAAPTGRVLREGRVRELPVEELVPGDVVALEAGDVVPADCRVRQASGLAADESALTGEAVPAAKSEAPVATEAPLAERRSMLYAGTAVVSGEGHALVVATGRSTVLGELGRLVATGKEPQTPLQRSMAELARAILVVAIAASVLVPLVGFLRGQPFTQMLLAGLTLAFATIPEELPILVSVLLAVGGRRLARRHALLRRLRAGETIGAVTVVVTDKTGTLTENRLRLARVDGERETILEAALATQSLPEGDGRVRDPLERALAEAANVASAPLGTVVASFPFDPERKRMSRVWRTDGGLVVYAKGAPEAILACCAVGDEERLAQARRVDALAGEGLRLIALARRRAEESPQSADEAERELHYLGLAAFDDPLREGVPEAVAALRRAGVATIVVTGDHPRTAAAVARRAGLSSGTLLLGGSELERMDEAELAQRLVDGAIVARATPQDKLRIVRLLQDRGEIVAVTGDGVNDAPALQAANVGIAMGKRGTDLAREAADLVLTDDAYPTIAAAVEGGRTIASQLRRAVAFYLGAKVALVSVLFVPLALGMRAPFTPVQIVLLELFMDLGASVAFVSEPAAPEAMRRPPRDPARRFLDQAELRAILLVAAALFVGVLGAFLAVHERDGAVYAVVAAFAAWLIGHAVVAWSVRARPLLSLADNPAFPAWSLAATLTALVVGATGVAGQLGLRPLGAGGWLIALAGAAAAAVVAATLRGVSGVGSNL
jgi:Ca2+-transporting ATPase